MGWIRQEVESNNFENEYEVVNFDGSEEQKKNSILFGMVSKAQ